MARKRSVVHAPRRIFSNEKPFRVGEEISLFDGAMIYAGRHPLPRFLRDGSVEDHVKFLTAGIPAQPRSVIRREARLSRDVLYELINRITRGSIVPKATAFQGSGEIDPVCTIIRTRDLARLATERGEKPRYLRHFQSEQKAHEPVLPQQQNAAPDGSTAVARRRRGPALGSLDRYGESDRALFPEIERLVRDEHKSVSAAALELTEKGEVKGTGAPKSVAQRLARRYRNRDQS
jgi:hypothetical protein